MSDSVACAQPPRKRAHYAAAKEPQLCHRFFRHGVFECRAELGVRRGGEEDCKHARRDGEHAARQRRGGRAEPRHRARRQRAQQAVRVRDGPEKLLVQIAAEPFGTRRAELLQSGEQIVRCGGDRVEKRGRGGEQRVRLRKQRRPQERQQPAEQKQQRQRQDQRGKATLKVKFPPQIQNDRFQQRRDEQREQKRQTPRQHIAKADIKERCTHEKRERQSEEASQPFFIQILQTSHRKKCCNMR